MIPVGKLDMGVVESVSVAVGPANVGAWVVKVGTWLSKAVSVAFTIPPTSGVEVGLLPVCTVQKTVPSDRAINAKITLLFI
jgi:hypothetical protein